MCPRLCTPAPTVRSGWIYRKIHMFDVQVGGVEYRESEHLSRPTRSSSPRPPTALGWGRRSATTCASELYRILALRGARIVTIPMNFTRVTGEAHWEVLVRARAIENQVFVIACQGRRPGPEGDSYGNSMIVDPWGPACASAGRGRASRWRRARPRAP